MYADFLPGNNCFNQKTANQLPGGGLRSVFGSFHFYTLFSNRLVLRNHPKQLFILFFGQDCCLVRVGNRIPYGNLQFGNDHPHTERCLYLVFTDGLVTRCSVYVSIIMAQVYVRYLIALLVNFLCIRSEV